MSKAIVTPRGIAAFSHIEAPETKGKFPSNKYKVTLKLKKGDKEVEEFVSKIRSMAKEAADSLAAEAKKKKLDFFDPIKDGDEKDEAEKYGWAGYWLFTPKSKYQPKRVDSKNNDLPASVKIMSGDEIRVAFVARTFKTPVQGKGGISTTLTSVRLIAKNAGGPGFEDEEEGYTYEAPDSTGDDSSDDADF